MGDFTAYAAFLILACTSQGLQNQKTSQQERQGSTGFGRGNWEGALDG